MKILKKYANGGSTKGDGTPRKPIHIRKPKERGNPFNTGTGLRKRKMSADTERMKKRQGPIKPAGPPARKYMGGGKMKEYANGGTEPHNSFDMRRNKRNKRRERFTGGSTEPSNSFEMRRNKRSRGGLRPIGPAGPAPRRRRPIGPAGPAPKMMGRVKREKKYENGGLNPDIERAKAQERERSKEGKRFDKKFSKKRKQYDKDIRKGKTKEMPHERTFKFRKKGESIFKKRGKFTVETAREKGKRKHDERMQHLKDTYKMKEGKRGKRFQGGGTIGRAPGGQKDEKQRERMRARLGGGADNPGRGGVKGMDTASFKKMREARRRSAIKKKFPGGLKSR